VLSGKITWSAGDASTGTGEEDGLGTPVSVAVDAEAMVTRIGALQEEGTETSPDLSASPLAVASVLSSPSLGKETPFLQEEARDKLRHGQKSSIRELAVF
jgi:hypothetical protein